MVTVCVCVCRGALSHHVTGPVCHDETLTCWDKSHARIVLSHYLWVFCKQQCPGQRPPLSTQHLLCGPGVDTPMDASGSCLHLQEQ